ncbi:MAG: SO_0444 family Cu/Zn efflux transporter [Candidatus Aureabacteria bacterium]|nr:SO_0444 family Cu/Zn efflux transporter [Candidatus Auribacterota bacterium]
MLSLVREIIALFIELAPFLMLGFFVSGVMNELLPEASVFNHLGGKNRWPEIKASLLGVPLPLCSCAMIPTAATLKKLGANNASVVSYITSTPQTGLDSFIVTYRFLGPVMAFFKPVAAFLMGVSGGYLVRCFGKNPIEIPNSISSPPPFCCHARKKKRNLLQIIKGIFHFGFITSFEDIRLWLIIGIIMGGLISWLIPDDFFVHYLKNDWLSMLLMVVAGAPLYICVTASIPIACALILKGLSPGAAFVFLTTGASTNLASILILNKIIGKQNTFIYLCNIVMGSILMGLLLNSIHAIFPIQVFNWYQHSHDSRFSALQVMLSIAFGTLLVRPYMKRLIHAVWLNKNKPDRLKIKN